MTARTRERLIGLVIGVICTLIAMMLIEIVGAREPGAQPISCMPSDQREKVREIMFEAINRGLEQRIVHVYEQWVIDDRDQPNRASVGARKAIRAWMQTHRYIEQWNPPPCP